MKFTNEGYPQSQINEGEKVKMGIRSQRKEILNDVLNELHGDVPSKKPIGIGVTSDEYVISQLEKLSDLL